MVVRVLFKIYHLVWINYLLGPSNVSLLGILELRKDTDAIILQTKNIVSADVTFFESVPYFSPQIPVITSESIPLPPYVSLTAHAHVLDVSSLVSLADTIETPIPKPFQDFRYVYTHR